MPPRLDPRQIQTLQDVARQNGVPRLRVSGSYDRGEATPGSELDLLVKMPRGASLIGFVRFRSAVAEALGLTVEAISENSIHPTIAPRIEQEAVTL